MRQQSGRVGIDHVSWHVTGIGETGNETDPGAEGC